MLIPSRLCLFSRTCAVKEAGCGVGKLFDANRLRSRELVGSSPRGTPDDGPDPGRVSSLRWEPAGSAKHPPTRHLGAVLRGERHQAVPYDETNLNKLQSAIPVLLAQGERARRRQRSHETACHHDHRHEHRRWNARVAPAVVPRADRGENRAEARLEVRRGDDFFVIRRAKAKDARDGQPARVAPQHEPEEHQVGERRGEPGRHRDGVLGGRAPTLGFPGRSVIQNIFTRERRRHERVDDAKDAHSDHRHAESLGPRAVKVTRPRERASDAVEDQELARDGHAVPQQSPGSRV